MSGAQQTHEGCGGAWEVEPENLERHYRCTKCGRSGFRATWGPRRGYVIEHKESRSRKPAQTTRPKEADLRNPDEEE